MISSTVEKILSNYESDNPGTKINLARMLMHGRLQGTGKLLILPVDQGFEHGPAKSFAINPVAHDPTYHWQLAVEAGLSAYAAPLGMLEVGIKPAYPLPLILKMNSSNSLAKQEPDQAITASVQDALRLGCVAVGFTLYPGSENYNSMVEEVRDIIEEAKYYGLAVVVWSYPRGAAIQKSAETALDIIAYGAHMACLLGAHIVKVKPPMEMLAHDTDFYQDITTLEKRIALIKQACFDGRRLVVFSGGNNKNPDALLEEIKAIHAGGGNGSIIGRNSFQRPRTEALSLLDKIINVYQDN